MAGINAVNTNATVRPQTFTPAVEGSDVQAGGASALRMQGDSFTSTIRAATPVIKFGLDHAGGLHIPGFGGGGAGGVMSPGFGGITGGVTGGVTGGAVESGMVFGSGAGGIGGAVSGVFSNITGALKNAFGVFRGALKANFLVSAAVSGVTNLIDVMTGKVSPQRAVATFAADTAVYTGIGATSTMIGATLGSLIPIPFVGTAIGLAAGFGLGLLYEKTIRQGLIGGVGRTMFNRNV